MLNLDYTDGILLTSQNVNLKSKKFWETHNISLSRFSALDCFVTSTKFYVQSPDIRVFASLVCCSNQIYLLFGFSNISTSSLIIRPSSLSRRAGWHLYCCIVDVVLMILNTYFNSIVNGVHCQVPVMVTTLSSNLSQITSAGSTPQLDAICSYRFWNFLWVQ